MSHGYLVIGRKLAQNKTDIILSVADLEAKLILKNRTSRSVDLVIMESWSNINFEFITLGIGDDFDITFPGGAWVNVCLKSLDGSDARFGIEADKQIVIKRGELV